MATYATQIIHLSCKQKVYVAIMFMHDYDPTWTALANYVIWMYVSNTFSL